MYERHRFISFAAGCIVSLVLFSLWTSQPIWSPHSPTELVIPLPDQRTTTFPVLKNASSAPSPPKPPPPPPLDPLSPLVSLNGPPSHSFRSNLKPGLKYITSWISAGWTNDVMTYANLIYLSELTDRIPIVPMFTPSHIGGGEATIPFGEVFDVPRLAKALGRPILEWRDVKDFRNDLAEKDEPLGCWNGWEAVQYREKIPRPSIVPQHLKLDLSYTKMPEWIKLIPKFEHDQHVTFWSFARFGFPETRNEVLLSPFANERVKPHPDTPGNPLTLASKAKQHTQPPDQHLLCFDYLYYVCAQQPFEFDYDFSPAWRNAGTHMHWVPELSQLADMYVRRALRLGTDAASIKTNPTPYYIVIHVRHADFGGWCGPVPLHDCFASLSVIGRRVQEVKDDLLTKRGVTVDHVVMTSDERNETWWEEVSKQGWLRLHHLEWTKPHTADPPSTDVLPAIPGSEEALKKYSKWYPVFVDAVVQSGGVGFVGTDRSTMSIIARRRVESWAPIPGGGVSRTVKWGHAGADDH